MYNILCWAPSCLLCLCWSPLCGFFLERSSCYLFVFFLLMETRLAPRHHQAPSLIICSMDHLWNQLVAHRVILPSTHPKPALKQCLASSPTLRDPVSLKKALQQGDWLSVREAFSELGVTCLGFEVQTHLDRFGALIHPVLLTLGSVSFFGPLCFPNVVSREAWKQGGYWVLLRRSLSILPRTDASWMEASDIWSQAQRPVQGLFCVLCVPH